ncbi:unnamed protein product [Protopolystoma xenopodis]|uniref:Uncharacterized protein n=1 Tax=Protopolystoma xenopodis TaxID=117903 RepID=A0A3S5FGB3_9PLAT|nr:unnamed protein product [Protopolystoma xenopodis]
MMLRVARLTDDADYDSGETFGNVPRPRLAQRLLPLSDLKAKVEELKNDNNLLVKQNSKLRAEDSGFTDLGLVTFFKCEFASSIQLNSTLCLFIFP